MPVDSSSPPTLDPVAVARWQRIAPPVAPWLHEEVARRMLERLQWIKLEPAAWAHWGAVRGGLEAHASLLEKYPKSVSFMAEAQSIRAQAAIDSIAKKWWQPASWRGRRSRVEAPGPASVDMVWANMQLHESAEPPVLLADWHRALKVDGFLMFSCLGPDTAREIRELHARLGWPPAGHDLTDMHDWGDMLVQGGFAEPVMDMERVTLTFDTPARLLQELAGLGRNFHPRRFASLRGRLWRQALEEAIKRDLLRASDGKLGLTFEIIYGHALKAKPKVKVSNLSAVSVEDMRSMLRGGRPPS